MFDGNHKGQRKVDLGGKKRDFERKEFLEKTSKLRLKLLNITHYYLVHYHLIKEKFIFIYKREDRAQTRLKINSATKVQKLFRKYICRIKYEKIWSNEFEKRISDVKKLQNLFRANGSSFSVPLDVINDRFICLFHILY